MREFTSLELHVLLQIKDQNVPMCGTLGSECPVMVRIDYQDAQGADNEWLQGFYWLADTTTPGNPSVCVTCNTRNPHIQVRRDIWYSYLSPNLVPLLSHDGQPPTMIESITVYASGHTYHAMVDEVELIGYR